MRVEPHLPPGVHVSMKPHRRWLTLQRADDDMTTLGPLSMTTDEHRLPTHGYVEAVRALGAWIPFLRRDLRRRLAAQHAVETILGIAYLDLSSRDPRPLNESTWNVRASTEAGGVVVRYQRPDQPAESIELDPLPFDLL